MMEEWKQGPGAAIHTAAMKKLGEMKLKTFLPHLFTEKKHGEDALPFVSTLKPIGNSGIKTLIARNLPRNIMVEELRTIFELYGSIRDIYIPKNMDKNSPHFGSIKGFALIKYDDANEARDAHHAVQGRLTIRTKNILVEFAKEDR